MTSDELDRGSALLGRMAVVATESAGLLQAVDGMDDRDVLARLEAFAFVIGDLMGVIVEATGYLQGVMETATREHVAALLGNGAETGRGAGPLRGGARRAANGRGVHLMALNPDTGYIHESHAYNRLRKAVAIAGVLHDRGWTAQDLRSTNPATRRRSVRLAGQIVAEETWEWAAVVMEGLENVRVDA